MALVQSLTKGKKTTFSHLFDDLIMVILNAFSYWNLIHVVPDRYDIKDSLNTGGGKMSCLKDTRSENQRERKTASFQYQEGFDEQQKQIKLDNIPYK